VAAIAAHIDAGPNLARAIANLDVRVPTKKQVSPTARSNGHPGRRERSVLRDQLVERSPAIDLLGGIEIEIYRPHVACGTGWGTDHRVGILLPPREDLRFIPGRIFEAVGGERLLVNRVARKDRSAATRIVERGLERGGCRAVLSRLRAHVILPPSL